MYLLTIVIDPTVIQDDLSLYNPFTHFKTQLKGFLGDIII